MADFDANGIVPTDLDGYVALLEAAFRTGLGADLNLATETPQGQLVGVLALAFAQIDELAVHVANGLDLHTAVGRQLGDYGTLLTLPRIDGERSTVTATLTGTPGTIVPRGARARTEAGAVFALDVRATIPGGGSVDALMRSAENGPIVAGAGELSRIVDAISGWTGVTNAAAAALGRDRETDAEYRRRYAGEIATHAKDALEAVRARVLAADGVTACLTRENTTAAPLTLQGIEIAARSLLVVVQGGAGADVAAAIAATKPVAGATSGDRVFDVPHAQGFTIPIRFRRVREVPVTVAVTLTADPTAFPATGFATMRENLFQWFAGMWPVPGPGIFHQDGVGIGQAVDLARIQTPLNAVPGHVLGSVTVRRVAGLLAGVRIVGGGGRYDAATTTVRFAGGNPTRAAEAVPVIEGGAVTAILVTDPGEGYGSVPNVVIEDSAGRGRGAAATAEISTADLGTPDLDQRYTLASAAISFQAL